MLKGLLATLTLALPVLLDSTGAPTPLRNPGVVFEIETTVRDEAAAGPFVSRIAVEGRDVRIDQGAGERPATSLLFRGKEGTLVLINHEEQYYAVLDEAARNRRGGTRPADRGIELRRSAEQETRAGYPCVKYDVIDDGRKIRERWVTGWEHFSGGAEAAGGLSALADFLMARPDVRALAATAMGEGGAWIEDLHGLEGFPVYTQRFDADGRPTAESTLKRTSRQTFEQAVFAPPDGYARRTLR